MHYIIDAYNLLFFLTDKINPVEKTREDLIDSLTSDLENLKIKASLVFDSGTTHQAHFPHTHERSSVEIVFSPHGICADRFILEILDQSKNTKDITVVTSDQSLQKQCKQRFAKTQSIESFLKYLNKRHRKNHTLPEKPHTQDQAYQDYLHGIFQKRLDEM